MLTWFSYNGYGTGNPETAGQDSLSNTTIFGENLYTTPQKRINMLYKSKSQWAAELAYELEYRVGGLIICDRIRLGSSETNAAHLFLDFDDITRINADDTCSYIGKILENGNPIILLNVNNSVILSKILGFGVNGQCVVIKPHNNYYEVNALGVKLKGYSSYCDKTLYQDCCGCLCFCDYDCIKKPNEPLAPFQNLCVSDQADMIAAILETDFEPSYSLGSDSPIRSTPTSLPLHQFKLIYLTMDARWNLTDRQITTNAVVMEISLIASFNPQYKYLRIRSLGAGFNPGPMESNDMYDRGYFQSSVNISMRPQTNRLTVLSTEPKNVNRQTQYTAGSSFSVGVDISKNPGFSASYTISQSSTTQISDFNVYNNGAGIIADWDFKLSMAENSIWNMFHTPFFRKTRVNDLPALATRNLQPVTDAVWFGSNTLNDTIGILLSWRVDHVRCWVTGNWARSTMWFTSRNRTLSNLFNVDFGSVYA